MALNDPQTALYDRRGRNPCLPARCGYPAASGQYLSGSRGRRGQARETALATGSSAASRVR